VSTDTLTAAQKQFIKLAEEHGLAVDYEYSGRGMFGRTCPAVRLKGGEFFPGRVLGMQSDSMGLGTVVYVP
jgi:hypothetical protein